MVDDVSLVVIAIMMIIVSDAVNASPVLHAGTNTREKHFRHSKHRCACMLVVACVLLTRTVIINEVAFVTPGDGFSLDNVVLQCAIQIPLWEQVTFYLLMPFAAALGPPIVVWLLFYVRYVSGHLCC